MSDKIFFLVDPDNITNNQFSLNKQESHHLINVLRKPIGTEIWLIDGIGSVYSGIFQNVQNGLVSGNILKVFPKYGENNILITMGVGILKRDKMNFVVEKATECGVNKIIPLKLDKCIKLDVNLERLIKISKSAVKQCGRSVIPEIATPIEMEELLNNDVYDTILVCHESGKKVIDVLPNLLENKTKILVLVGPEGDFSTKEISFIKELKVNFINLGNRRLRSETAVITAISQINLFNN